MQKKQIDKEGLLEKLYSLYGTPDDRGFIYVEDQEPNQIEDTLKKELNSDLSNLAIHVTLCSYEKGTVIKI